MSVGDSQQSLLMVKLEHTFACEVRTMLVNKAYKFRIYPTKEQEILIAKTIGCFVFNGFLGQWNDTYKEANMLKNHRLAKAISEVSWSQLKNYA